MIPTCDEIKEAVRKYHRENPTEDDTLRSALRAMRSLPPSFGRFLAEVCVIASWGSISHFPFLDRVEMANEIKRAWPLLEPMLEPMSGEDWDAETKMVIGAVEPLSRTNLLLPPGAKRRQLSFLSKYLHWCVNGGFPIWDSQARAALNYNAEVSWEAYRGWLIRVREEAATHKACCLEHERPRDECLLRTLDKALYEIGTPQKD